MECHAVSSKRGAGNVSKNDGCFTWVICLIYLDDVLIFIRTFDEHIDRFRLIMSRFRDAGGKLRPNICFFHEEKIKSLGFIVSSAGVAVDDDKISAVRDFPQPSDVAERRRFLGMTSFYRRFIIRYSDIAKPLYRLTEKGMKFIWHDNCNIACNTLKKCLVQVPVICFPYFTKPFVLTTYVSEAGLSQHCYES